MVAAMCVVKVTSELLLNISLLLNVDKFGVMFIGSSSQLKAASSVNIVSVAGVSLPVSSAIKSLGVVIDSRLMFDATSQQSVKPVIITHGHCVTYVVICQSLLCRHWHAALSKHASII